MHAPLLDAAAAAAAASAAAASAAATAATAVHYDDRDDDGCCVLSVAPETCLSRSALFSYQSVAVSLPSQSVGDLLSYKKLGPFSGRNMCCIQDQGKKQRDQFSCFYVLSESQPVRK